VAQKKNNYQKIDIGIVKLNVQRNIDYLASINVAKIEDEVGFTTTTGGGSVPKVISSIEQQLGSFVNLIIESIEQLKRITEIEKTVSPWVENLLYQLTTHIDAIENYFNIRPPETIVNRKISIPRTSRGKTYDQILIAANVPTQQNTRTKTLRIVLQMKQIMISLEKDQKEEKFSKGGTQTHVRLRKFINA
jgi:hypothetical protein